MARDVMGRLGGGAEVNIGGPDPDVGGAIELASLINGEISLENNFGRRSRAGGGRGVSKALGIKIGEFELLIERDFAGRGVRARHARVCEGRVARTDYKLRGGDSGEQRNQ